MMNGISTYILIGITVAISFLSWQRADLLHRLLFYPAVMRREQSWWRFITHGLIHADLQHLIFNMLTLFFFGPLVERVFGMLFGNGWMFPVYYLFALIFSATPSYYQHQHNANYRALGASGAISAVLFTTILFDPWQTLYLQFFIPIPAILFAIGYLWYSNYMRKRGMDHIGHDAHLWGALFGLVFPIILKPQLLMHFIEQLKHPRFGF